jgi:hypothetical protein
MTMRDAHTDPAARETASITPVGTEDAVDTNIGFGAPPEYAADDVDLRDGRDRRVARRRDLRDDDYDYDMPRRYRDYRYDDDRSFADEAAMFARRHIRTPETKEFFSTSEFFFTIVGLVGLAVAASVHEVFDAEQMWPLVTLLLSAYIVSRGIAKAGTPRTNPDRARYR